ncbi:BON domain-containing protein [Paracoccus sp. S-4012]|nr:BON domain-containing protein [Paracoccus sp. S-4012]
MSSHRGRGPKGYSRSDERIREDVSDRLSDDHSLDASDIEVSVSGGEVTLSGNVDSRQDKRRAEDIADDVPGVNHVQNNLRVKTGSTQGGSSGQSASSSGSLGSTGGSGSVSTGSAGATSGKTSGSGS